MSTGDPLDELQQQLSAVTSNAPGFIYSNNTDTGMWRTVGADTISFSVGGVDINQRLRDLDTQVMQQNYMLGRISRDVAIKHYQEFLKDNLQLVEQMEQLDNEKDNFYRQVYNQMKEFDHG